MTNFHESETPVPIRSQRAVLPQLTGQPVVDR